jgi:hypothetical protein
MPPRGASEGPVDGRESGRRRRSGGAGDYRLETAVTGLEGGCGTQEGPASAGLTFGGRKPATA